MKKGTVRLFDSSLENFWPRTSRENYLYKMCLEFMDDIENFYYQREALYDQISIRDEGIKDLNLKLQDEHENSQNWENRMLEEISYKNIAVREFELNC